MKLIGSINHWRADSSGWIGSATMLLFSGIAAFRWQSTGILFFGLLFFRDIAAAWFLISRNPSLTNRKFGWIDLLAYVSSATGFMYFGDSHPLFAQAVLVANILSIVGFSIATIALFEIGTSFGVSPANRGFINTGIYRAIRHPMYAGYVVAEIGFILLNPVNLIVFIFSLILYVGRAKLENQMLIKTPEKKHSSF